MTKKLLLAATLLPLSCAFAADFFPLRHGNAWTYRESRTGQSFEIRVGAPAFVNGKIYHFVSGYTIEQMGVPLPRPVLARLNEHNALVMLEDDQVTERPLTLFEPFEGGWWEAPLREGCATEGQTLERRGEHDGPAGPINSVLEVRYRTWGCADIGVTQEQYAENIGMVRRVTTSIAGPRTWDLVRARLGTIHIDALPTGRFSISVDTRPGPATWSVVLRLDTNSPLPVPIVFPSAQEYDVALRNSKGETVWTWSADKSFAQVLSERRILQQWTTGVEVPKPQEPGDYVLDAWLTTAPQPRFAASVPVRVE